MTVVATVAAAQLGWDKDVGSLTPGHWADMVAVAVTAAVAFARLRFRLRLQLRLRFRFRFRF